ncbi:unnamed protein product, partial [Allacma fusca]
DDLANFSQDYPRYFPRQGSLRQHHHFHPYYPPSTTRQVRRSTPERPTIRVPRTRNFVRDERNPRGGHVRLNGSPPEPRAHSAEARETTPTSFP